MKIQDKIRYSLITVCIIPLLVTSFLIYKQARKAIETSAMELVALFNSQVVQTIDDFLDDYEQVTKSVLTDYDIINMLNDNDDMSMYEKVNRQLALQKVMTRLLTLKPDIMNIMICTKDGEIYTLSNNNQEIYDITALKEQSWLQDMLSVNDIFVITGMHACPYYSRNKDSIVLTLGRKLYDTSGVYTGILLLDLKPSSMIALSEQFLFAENNYDIRTIVMKNSNEILYDSEFIRGNRKAQEVISPKIQNTDYDSDAYIVLSELTEHSRLEIKTIIKRSNLLADIKKINLVTTFIITVSVLLLIAVSMLLSHNLTRPLKELQENMKQVEGGEYKYILHVNVKDEIGELVQSYNAMIKYIKELIEDVYKAEIEQKNARILTLQTQINPHMLYNTLESIRMKALLHGDEEIEFMIKILSRMLRSVLTKRDNIDTVREEIEYLENYIKLQNIRFNNQIFLQIDMPEELMDRKIMALMFQPIVENSIEHGRFRSEPLHICIRGEILEDNKFIIQISDDGKGMSEEILQMLNTKIAVNNSCIENTILKDSIGLKNIAERIYLKYGKDSYLRIVSSDMTGTTVEIKIDII